MCQFSLRILLALVPCIGSFNYLYTLLALGLLFKVQSYNRSIHLYFAHTISFYRLETKKYCHELWNTWRYSAMEEHQMILLYAFSAAYLLEVDTVVAYFYIISNFFFLDFPSLTEHTQHTFNTKIYWMVRVREKIANRTIVCARWHRTTQTCITVRSLRWTLNTMPIGDSKQMTRRPYLHKIVFCPLYGKLINNNACTKVPMLNVSTRFSMAHSMYRICIFSGSVCVCAIAPHILDTK